MGVFLVDFFVVGLALGLGFGFDFGFLPSFAPSKLIAVAIVRFLEFGFGLRVEWGSGLSDGEGRRWGI